MYFNRFNLLIREFCAAGGVTSNEELVTDLLASLPEEFETHISVLEAMDVKNAELDLEAAQKFLLEVDLRKRLKKDESEGSSAFASKGNPRNPKASGSSDDDVTCFTCGKKGHKSPKCPDKKSKPRGKKNRDKQANVSEQSSSHAFLGEKTASRATDGQSRDY